MAVAATKSKHQQLISRSLCQSDKAPSTISTLSVLTHGTFSKYAMGHRHALTSCSGVGRNLPCQNCSDLPDNVKLDNPTLEGDDSRTMKWKWNKQTAKERAKKNNQNDSLIGTAYVARDVKAIAEAADDDGLIRYAGLQAISNFDGAAKNFFKQCADAGLDFCAVAEVVDNEAKSGEELRTTYDSFLAKLTKDFSGKEDKNFIARNAFFDKLYFQAPTAFRDFAKILKGWYDAPSTVQKLPDAITKREELFEAKTYQNVKRKDALSGIRCGDRPNKKQATA
ncbi:hypothetical protein SLS59_004916 [Nothophoma quercina]|uniref:Uncharacterized protein n=1 Tax=Nothophoma quercina TaxID=749835 RepID=A0ABR3RCP6_9PLEO